MVFPGAVFLLATNKIKREGKKCISPAMLENILKCGRMGDRGTKFGSDVYE